RPASVSSSRRSSRLRRVRCERSASIARSTRMQASMSSLESAVSEARAESGAFMARIVPAEKCLLFSRVSQQRLSRIRRQREAAALKAHDDGLYRTHDPCALRCEQDAGHVEQLEP